ncbi:MAG: hypothetical protein ACJ718_00540 [Nitrososphaeraceae archaeon]
MVEQTKTITISNSAEEIIARQIERIQKMIRVRDCPEEELGIHINPAMKRHWELEIKTLQDAPRDADRLKELLKTKRREYEKSRNIDDILTLITAIEMLQFILFLVCRNEKKVKKVKGI